MPATPEVPGTYLGFDFGLARIGVAVGDSITGSARPLKTVTRDWPGILALLAEWQPQACVVGLPLTADGGEQEITATARRFAGRLRSEWGGPVHLVDERMSSLSATTMMRATRSTGGRRRPMQQEQIDSQAACLILQQWMDERP